MSLKVVLSWLIVAFIVWFIIVQPAGAPHIVHNIGTFLTSMANGISHFFASI